MSAAAKALRVLVRIVGLAIAGFGLLADLLGVGGEPGIGLKQLVLVAAGVLLAVAAGKDRRSLSNDAARLRTWAADADDAMGAGRIALFAIAVGLGTGFFETLVLGIHRFGMNGIVRVSPHIVWMAPLWNCAILLMVGGVLWLGGRLWPKLATPAVVGVVFFLLGADAVLSRIPVRGQISDAAQLVLLLGIALAVGRGSARRWAAAGPRAWRGVAAAAAVVVLVGIAATVHPGWKERRALSALPDGPSGGLNVVLIILDTVRAASLSLYGYERPTTPELDRFAEGGVVFTKAVSPSSWTLPSHATLFTGRHPHEFDVDWFTPLDDAHLTLAEVLAEAGYATAAFSANLGYVSVESGLGRGFARFEDFVATPGETVRISVMLARVLQPFGLSELVNDDNRGRRMASDINGAFLRWLDRRPADRPYFAFLNYFDAHVPYYAPPPYDTLFGGRNERLPRLRPAMTAEDVAEWRAAYDRSLVYLDSQLGILFRELERRGELDRTLIVVSSDHGEHFGENGYMDHATTLYRPVIEVPLVFRGPGIPAGTRADDRVGLRDVAATLLDLTGVEAAGRIPGSTLATAWSGGHASDAAYANLGRGKRIPAHYPNAANDLQSVVASDLHYIVSTSGAEELYRISTDPEEEVNLIHAEPPAAESMRERLRAFEADKGPMR